ncbi:MGMT family protein [Candidatus Izemoplasma sp. B36]|uniref:MGMT family protein n=1 Tax=Candidatus Izemoplasma sp. B36 TaxID=3242468 RepID=UPI0035573D51
MNKFTIDVIETIKNIPKGKVMTYGQIATFCGNPYGARQVSRILYSSSKKYHLPWHRVINSKGMISLHGEGKLMQLERLFEEGIKILNNKIDLNKYLHKPWDKEI